jgi:hypothetical protein
MRSENPLVENEDEDDEYPSPEPPELDNEEANEEEEEEKPKGGKCRFHLILGFCGPQWPSKGVRALLVCGTYIIQAMLSGLAYYFFADDV